VTAPIEDSPPRQFRGLTQGAVGPAAQLICWDFGEEFSRSRDEEGLKIRLACDK
jgi:hypothetical protein